MGCGRVPWMRTARIIKIITLWRWQSWCTHSSVYTGAILFLTVREGLPGLQQAHLYRNVGFSLLWLVGCRGFPVIQNFVFRPFRIATRINEISQTLITRMRIPSLSGFHERWRSWPYDIQKIVTFRSGLPGGPFQYLTRNKQAGGMWRPENEPWLSSQWPD